MAIMFLVNQKEHSTSLWTFQVHRIFGLYGIHVVLDDGLTLVKDEDSGSSGYMG